MIRARDRHQHTHWGYHVEVTDVQGQWIEFIQEGSSQLQWLEHGVFEQAYTLVDRLSHYSGAWGDLTLARERARSKGLHVPVEFLPR